MPQDRDAYRVVPTILIGLVIAVSIAAAIVLGKQRSADIHQDLNDRSQTIAAAIGREELSKLQGERSDTQRPAYSALKAQLTAVKQANHGVRSIYLMGKKGDKLFFYVDSEKPGSRDYSPAAEVYEDATPALKAMFSNGKPLVEGPITDDFGTFISGLAPVKSSNGSVIAVAGLDIDADTYWRTIALAATIPLTTGLSLVLIIVIFEWIRRRNIQLLALRSELVSVASHELRTPIIGIKWAAESLDKMVSDEKALPYIHAIHNSALSLQASADDILELTSTISNQKVVLKPIHIRALIQDVFDTQTLSAEQKNVTLRMTDSVTPDTIVVCDVDKMRRVFHNMISNGIKYTREGTAVTVSLQEDDKTQRLLISDQGIGIPPTEQDRVLQGFYRASNAIASKVQGTGLGLYLVKTVLEQHGGKVSFISEQNEGTTFTLSLPKRSK